MTHFECHCDYEPATIYRASRHKARKAYVCDECRQKVKPGERYERAVMFYDGRWDVCMTCVQCLRIRDFVEGNIPCFCFAHSQMLERARETVYEAAEFAPDETKGLIFGFLRRVVQANRARAA